MTNDIDWEAEMEALDASLPERLERAAHMAERSDIWTDTERLMPATGVADLIWEAHSEILGWRALNEERKSNMTCPLGEDCDLHAAAVAELVEGLREMRDRWVLYCGGRDGPLAGKTDTKVLDMAEALIAKHGEQK